MTSIPNFPSPKINTLNDIELEVFEAGQENKGNPIVLYYGWPEHAYSWQHQLPALAYRQAAGTARRWHGGFALFRARKLFANKRHTK